MRQSDMARHPVSSAAESAASLPRAQGLYDPRFEHDACGIGMIVQTDGEKSHVLVDQAINMLERMAHRGGVGNEADTGDGAGILLQIPHMFLAKAAAYSGFELPEAGDYGVAMLFTSPDEKRADDSVRRFCGLPDSCCPGYNTRQSGRRLRRKRRGWLWRPVRRLESAGQAYICRGERGKL